MEGLRWVAAVGPCPLGAWGVAMDWSRPTLYSHTKRLREAGWLGTCLRTRGEGALVYASRSGVRACGVKAAVVERRPAANTWPHCDASAWTAAWVTTHGRGIVGPREMLVKPEWRGEVRWREHGEMRKRGHRPDLAIRIPDGRVLPVEVELTDKSPARLKSVFELHARWIVAGLSPAVIYVCSNEDLAGRVRAAGEAADLSVERGTLRVELLDAITQDALQRCGRAAASDWGTPAEAVAA
jgi:hypothetical protein